MSLETEVMTAMKAAMKAKDKVALDSLRAIKSEILLAKTGGQGVEVSEAQEIAILQRMVKQRKDSYAQYHEQGREDLAEIEQAQMEVIQQFLPKQLTPQELEVAVQKIIEEVGAQSIKDLGKVMGKASQALSGQSDGKSISEMAKRLLS